MARAWNRGDENIVRGIFRWMNAPQVGLKKRRRRMRSLPNIRIFRVDFDACHEAEIVMCGDCCGESAAAAENFQRLKWWRRAKPITNRERANGRFYFNDVLACIDPYLCPASERLENGAVGEIDNRSRATGGASLGDMMQYRSKPA